MSYSVCLRCRKAVSAYEKYCDKCEITHKQDKDFWRSQDNCEIAMNPILRDREVRKDEKK